MDLEALYFYKKMHLLALKGENRGFVNQILPFQLRAEAGLFLSPSRHMSRACWILSSVHEVCCIVAARVLLRDERWSSVLFS